MFPLQVLCISWLFTSHVHSKVIDLLSHQSTNIWFYEKHSGINLKEHYFLCTWFKAPTQPSYNSLYGKKKEFVSCCWRRLAMLPQGKSVRNRTRPQIAHLPKKKDLCSIFHSQYIVPLDSDHLVQGLLDVRCKVKHLHLYRVVFHL